MLLRAGALSLALLLASRLLGLLRESAIAATFGTSGLADVAVLMLTLPDWVAGILASGALAYVLLPAWTGKDRAQVAASQRRVARTLVLAGLVFAIVLALLRQDAVSLLAGGLPDAVRGIASEALVWSALALPAALLAALWTTRLQHESDFLGMYSVSLVVNLVLLAAIAFVALGSGQPVILLGCGLLLAMGLRLGWLWWRQGPAVAIEPGTPASLPPFAIWWWAVLSAGLPLALPFAARSMASRSGEGALATFNYAWKLVELPLMLAIQLVATLAFPAIAKALSGVAKGGPGSAADGPVGNAFALAFALACACAAGLLAGAPALAQLLFGWGRMGPQALEQVAQWARIGAWGLLPQALIAVALTVLAAQGRMRPAVLGYAVALLALGWYGERVSDGGRLLMAVNILLAFVATVALAALGKDAIRWLPWKLFAGPLAALGAVAFAVAQYPVPAGVLVGLLLAVISAGVVLATAWLSRSEIRRGGVIIPPSS